MAGGDLFALGSVHEGLPVAVMEALALGLPIVATAVGGVPEAVMDGVEGRLVPPRNPEALADALVDVARDDGTRARLAAAAREREAAFDIGRAMRRYERCYLDLRGGPHPR